MRSTALFSLTTEERDKLRRLFESIPFELACLALKKSRAWLYFFERAAWLAFKRKHENGIRARRLLITKQ